jgi:uncharacterized protein (TIGR03437 family)
MNNAPLPILSISPTAVWFQVPFDLVPGPAVTVELAHTSVFQGCPSIGVYVVSRTPYLITGQNGYLSLAHQDFSSLVTPASPAQPGEIVHAYAVGLGVVVPAMQTGVPTPTGQLFPLANPIDCSVGYSLGGQQLNVLFAGLAPGTIGIYQIDVQMPSTLPSRALALNCGTPGDIYERSIGAVATPTQPQ